MGARREIVQVDFRGLVRFLPPEEGGLQQTPVTGYRCDFRYAGQSEKNNWMVWPLWFFVDGKEVAAGVRVPRSVEAGFFVLDRELLERIHRPRLYPGVRFELCEGSRVVATGEVTSVNLPTPGSISEG